MLPVLGGMLLLLDQPSSAHRFGRLFASGVLFGIGVLMKQPGLLFILFAAIYIMSGMKFAARAAPERNGFANSDLRTVA